MCKLNVLTKSLATLALTVLVMSTGILAQPDCQNNEMKLTRWTDQPPAGGTIDIWGPELAFRECAACCVTLEIYGLPADYSIVGGFQEYEIFTGACDSDGNLLNRTLIREVPFDVQVSDGVNPIEIEFCSSGFEDSDSFELHTDPVLFVYLDGQRQHEFGVGGNLAPGTGWDQTCNVLGCTPGYWKNHLDSWCEEIDPRDLYCEVLGLSGENCPDSGLLMKKAIDAKGNKQCQALIRHSAAAVLNACSFDPAEVLCDERFDYAYPYSVQTVQGLTASGFANDCNEIKDMLEHANEQMCGMDSELWLGTRFAGDAEECGGWDESCNPYWEPNP